MRKLDSIDYLAIAFFVLAILFVIYESTWGVV